MQPTALEPTKGPWIGLVFIGPDRCLAAFWHDSGDQFLHTLSRGLGSGTTMLLFEQTPLFPLSGPHRATPAQLRFSHAVDEVRGPDHEVQVKGPVLAVLEGSKAVEYQRFIGCRPGTKQLVEEQAVAAKALRLELKSSVGDAELSADLTETRATDQAMEEGFEEVGMAEPVGGREGL